MKKLVLILAVLSLALTSPPSEIQAKRSVVSRYLIKKVKMPKPPVSNYGFMSEVVIGTATGASGAYVYDKLSEEKKPELNQGSMLHRSFNSKP